MQIEDYGKVAATFINIEEGRAVRLAPSIDARERAAVYASKERRHYSAQLAAYQSMPDAELLSIQDVRINMPVETPLSRPGVRAMCALCGEEVISGREVQQVWITLCLACARGAYYQTDPIEGSIAAFSLVSAVERRS